MLWGFSELVTCVASTVQQCSQPPLRHYVSACVSVCACVSMYICCLLCCLQIPMVIMSLMRQSWRHCFRRRLVYQCVYVSVCVFVSVVCLHVMLTAGRSIWSWCDTVRHWCYVWCWQLDKAYDPDAPEDDMVERYEEMNRMREHVMKEVDKNNDRLISLEEFLDSTRQSDFKKDVGWEVCCCYVAS